MKTAILYSSPTPQSDTVQILPGLHVRAEVVENGLSEALDGAVPRPNETVLNTVEIE